MRTTTRAGDYAWGFLAGLMAVLTTLNTVACLFAVVVGGNVVGLLRLPVGLLFGYWMGMGAWRRTRWGAAPAHGVDAGPPLSAGHVRGLVLLALGAAIALALALAFQTLAARS